MQNNSQIINNKKTFFSYIQLYVTCVLLVIFLQACVTTTYKRPDFPEIKEEIKFSKIYQHYLNTFQNKGVFTQKVVIELKGRSIPALGMCSYNVALKNIALTLLTTTGIKIFEFKENNGIIRKAFIMPDMAKNIRDGKKAVEQIADDVKRIYFKPNFEPTECSKSKNTVSLFFKKDIRKVELKFGWDPTISSFVLREKYFYLKSYPESAVFYYDYKKYNGKLIPMRIRYENYLYDYNLTLKNTEVINNAEKAISK